MEQNFYAKLYEQFEKELKRTGDVEIQPLKCLSSDLATVRKYLTLLRTEVEVSGFKDLASEIDFFKFIKPKFYRWLVYYQEHYAIESGRPLREGKKRLAYYAEQLRFLGNFFRRYEFHFQYYRLGATELDHLWFVRGAAPTGPLTPEVPEVDPAFGTAQDYLFAKFSAYELLQGYLLNALAVPEENFSRSGLNSRKGVQLRWTADTCNLIELVYGLYETRQVNNGEVDLSDLMDVFEQVFQVNLSRYFRRFTEIKRRKTISKTKFLDQMRDAVNQRIDDSDALVVKGKKAGNSQGKDAGSGLSDKMDLLRNNPYL